MVELKPLSREGVTAALEKAEQYRRLNEPVLAESICLDVLEIDPQNREALVTLLLARTDQFGKTGQRMDEVRSLLAGLTEEYDRLYYAGIICERWAMALLARSDPGCGAIAYDWFRKAMVWYEKAEKIRPAGLDDAILRWNTCARMIQKHEHVRPHHEDEFLPMLE